MGEDKTLHFIRVRAKGDPEFYDPQTDVRKLLPGMFDNSIKLLDEMHPDAGYLKLLEKFKLFQIRVDEDESASVSDIMDEFFKALDGDRDKMYDVYRLFTLQALTMYGLFCRRDAKADPASVKEMACVSCYTAMRNMLPSEKAAALSDDLKRAGVSLHEEAAVRAGDGYAVCEETGDVIRHVRMLASLYANVPLNGGWNDVAEAFDRAFSEKFSRGDDNEAKDTHDSRVAVALTGGTFDNPGLTIAEEVDDGVQGEA